MGDCRDIQRFGHLSVVNQQGPAVLPLDRHKVGNTADGSMILEHVGIPETNGDWHIYAGRLHRLGKTTLLNQRYHVCVTLTIQRSPNACHTVAWGAAQRNPRIAPMENMCEGL